MTITTLSKASNRLAKNFGNSLHEYLLKHYYVMPHNNFHIKRIGKKRWGIFNGSSARVIHEIRGSWPSAKEQFVVWKVTRRLGI